MKLVSDQWFDGSWWETKVPGDFRVVEKSGQHLRLESRTNASVMIGIRKHVRIVPGSRRDYWARKNLSEAEEWAYSSAKNDATMGVPLLSILTLLFRRISKTVLGELTGYTFTKRTWRKGKVWTGFFTHKDWGLYLHLNSSPMNFESNKEVVANVLSSMEFKA